METAATNTTCDCKRLRAMNKDMRARLTAMTAERDTAMVHYTIMAQKAQQHLALVREVLEDYAMVLETLPARSMVRCHRLTEQRIAEILAGKRQPHDVEVMDL